MYLGIDLGTSGIKVVLATESQKVIASATAPLEVHKPRSGWVEQDPQHWIDATRTAISQLRGPFPSELRAVRAIGLSGQMHGATLLDAKDRILRPCILWNDTRSHLEAAALDDLPAFRQVTGNIVFPGFTAPKLKWVQQHEPDLFARVNKVLLPKDYLRLWLTGETFSDCSDASGTSWLDVGNRSWSEELLSSCDLRVSHMPSLVEGSEPAGQVRPAIAGELGLGEDVIVAGGAGDNAATAIATGITQPGSAFVSIGTSGVLFAATDSFLPNPDSAVHAFCHALPDRWHQMGVILSASAALAWFADLVGQPVEVLTTELGAELRAPSGALFLPYLAGERTPHNDAMVRGSFHGLGGEMTRQALTQAVLEGVAFAFRDNLASLQATGTQLESVIATGGGMNSEYWLKVIATVLDLPIEVPEQGGYGAALGAVRLAMLADGQSEEETLVAPRLGQTIEPVIAMQAGLNDNYQRFKAAYALAV